jgi:hypothetical protein
MVTAHDLERLPKYTIPDKSSGEEMEGEARRGKGEGEGRREKGDGD